MKYQPPLRPLLSSLRSERQPVPFGNSPTFVQFGGLFSARRVAVLKQGFPTTAAPAVKRQANPPRSTDSNCTILQLTSRHRIPELAAWKRRDGFPRGCEAQKHGPEPRGRRRAESKTWTATKAEPSPSVISPIRQRENTRYLFSVRTGIPAFVG
jgi:hypothetical protein